MRRLNYCSTCGRWGEVQAIFKDDATVEIICNGCLWNRETERQAVLAARVAADSAEQEEKHESHCYAASFLHVKASPELDVPNQHSLALIVGNQEFHLGYYEDECSAECWKSMWAKALTNMMQEAAADW